MLHIILDYVNSNVKMLLKTKDTYLNKFAVCIKRSLIRKKGNHSSILSRKNLMQGIVYSGDRRAEKLNGKCQMMKWRLAQAGCLRCKRRKQRRRCPTGQRGEMKNPDCSLSPTFQTSPVPHISQMQLENRKLTTDSPNKALICGICQFL